MPRACAKQGMRIAMPRAARGVRHIAPTNPDTCVRGPKGEANGQVITPLFLVRQHLATLHRPWVRCGRPGLSCPGVRPVRRDIESRRICVRPHPLAASALFPISFLHSLVASSRYLQNGIRYSTMAGPLHTATLAILRRRETHPPRRIVSAAR
jgi:hypothetical protein